MQGFHGHGSGEINGRVILNNMAMEEWVATRFVGLSPSPRLA